VSDTNFHILLLRHGITDSNAGGVLQGHLPTPLNDLGHRQAEQLAGRVAQWTPRVRAIVSSDLRRATQTTSYLASSLQIEPTFDSAWRERGLGEFEGKTVGQKRMWDAASGEETPPGAESVEAFHARIAAALSDMRRRFADQDPVAIVTHGGAIRVILRMLNDGRLPLAPNQPKPEVALIGNCSIWHLTHNGAGWAVACANDVGHLDEETSADAG
jgi:broad specificity phosphatase PhoE